MCPLWETDRRPGGAGARCLLYGVGGRRLRGEGTAPWGGRGGDLAAYPALKRRAIQISPLQGGRSRTHWLLALKGPKLSYSRPLPSALKGRCLSANFQSQR